MKIEAIEVEILDHRYTPQFLVRISTDEGLTGVGELWWGLEVKPIISAIEDLFAPILIGEDSSRIEYLWDKMARHAYRYGTEGVTTCGLSAIDIALWDLLGKRLNVPVYQLLGGIVHEGIRAYASLPIYNRAEIVQEEVEHAKTKGFAGVKLHTTDLKIVAAAREAEGKDYPIMLDVSGKWAVLETMDNADFLESQNVFWLEEPIWPMQDHESLLKIRQRTSVKMAAGENEFTLNAFDRLMTSGAVEYIQPEITKMGGLSMARKISVLADLYNLVICPHSFRIGPAAVANFHWAFSQTHMDWLEVPLLRADGEFPAGVSIPEIVGGKMQPPPDAPGLGLAL